jgi:hypothetical protein
LTVAIAATTQTYASDIDAGLYFKATEAERQLAYVCNVGASAIQLFSNGGGI